LKSQARVFGQLKSLGVLELILFIYFSIDGVDGASPTLFCFVLFFFSMDNKSSIITDDLFISSD
jgi:hypothetical protein